MLIVLVLLFVGKKFIYKKFQVLTVFNPDKISILKPKDFLVLGDKILKDELSINKDGFIYQFYSYLSDKQPLNVFNDYKNYFNLNNWVIKKELDAKSSGYLIEADKNGLTANVAIIYPDGFFYKTLIFVAFIDNSKRFSFDYLPANIKFIHPDSTIDFDYDKYLTRISYESYLDRDSLYNIYKNYFETLGWSIKNLKTGVISKMFFEVIKDKNINDNNQIFFDIDRVLISPNDLSLYKTRVGIFLFKNQ